jgi:hypothetical protein
MSHHHRITLFANRNQNHPVELVYVESPLRKAQARFSGRRVLTPQIDLGAYRWASVIDWIDVEFELSRRTQHWKINERIERLTGRKEYPEALDLDAEAGNTATRYKLRVQEPDMGLLHRIIDDIKGEYGFVAPAVVKRLEVSIDAYPETPSEEARARLHGVLVRHFFPTTKVLTDNLKWPRFTPGVRKRKGDYIVARNLEDPRQDVVDRMTPATDRQPLYTSTFYVGEKDDPHVMWRIQNKTIDKQNKAAGARLDLTDEEKRVRIEVTLGPEGCREVGLLGFDSLAAFRFTKLQKHFFQFMLPTFGAYVAGGAGAHSSAVKQCIEDMRRQRFLNVGVLGLQIREDATEDFRKLEMTNFLSWHKARGSRLPRKQRRGSGPYGTMVAYEELARVVERALAGLQGRVQRELGL